MEPKHSGLGIVSFLLSLFVAMGAFVLFAIAALLSMARHASPEVRHMGQVLFLLCLIVLVFTDLVALGLGVAGLAQTGRKKLFAVLGTVFAGLQVATALIVFAVNVGH